MKIEINTISDIVRVADKLNNIANLISELDLEPVSVELMEDDEDIHLITNNKQ